MTKAEKARQKRGIYKRVRGIERKVKTETEKSRGVIGNIYITSDI